MKKKLFGFIFVVTILLMLPVTVFAAEPYLTFSNNENFNFTSGEEFTLKVKSEEKNWDGTLEYSEDLETWTEWNGKTITAHNGVLYLHGKNNTVITGSSGSDNRFVFGGSDSIYSSGNIEALRGTSDEMADSCYRGLFYNCSALKTAPELPAETLAAYSYAYMFYGCTGLESVPNMNVKTMSRHSCYYMFYGCTGLESVPEDLLENTKMAANSCEYMFYGCTSLTNIPKLPVAKNSLAAYCYGYMFSGCSSLKVSENTVKNGTILEWEIPAGVTRPTLWSHHMFYKTGGDYSTGTNNGAAITGNTYYIYIDKYFDYSFSGENYTLVGESSGKIGNNETKTFTITADEGYRITDVTASNAKIIDNGDETYTLSDPTDVVVITVGIKKHTYEVLYNNEKHWKECSECQDKIEESNHTFVVWTSVDRENHKSKCTLEECRQEKTENHVYTTKITAPTCTAKGYTTYTCSVCDDSYKDDETEKIAHTAGDVVAENEVAATCTSTGSYDNVIYCSVCSTEMSRETVITDMVAHTSGEVTVENEVEATYTSTGSYDNVIYCTECNTELSRETVITEKIRNNDSGTPVYSTSDAIGDYENGKVSANFENPSAGVLVTLTVIPDEGYEVGEITITDENGKEIEVINNGDGTYSYRQPESEIVIDIDFVEIEEEKEDKPEEPKTEIVLTIGYLNATVNGETIIMDVAPVIRNGRTMLPIRFIVEELGGKIEWDDEVKKVTITKGDLTIEIFIGSPFALVNNTPVELDSPAFIENGRTYLPLKFVADNLGADVEWIDETKTVIITEK